MLKTIILSLIFLAPVSYAQDVMTTDQQAVTVTRTAVPATATPVVTPVAPVVTTPATPVLTTPVTPVSPDIAVTPAFGGAVTTIPATTDILNTTSQTALCPPLSFYYIPQGYRIAGMSPTCQVVVVPMEEPTS